MKVTAKLNNLRVSPRKVRIVANMVRGMKVNDALVQLENTVKKSSPHLVSLIKSAMANAENNFGLDKNNLFVYDIQIGEGMKYKRWMPRAYGRASQIIKRGSNITLVLDELKVVSKKKEATKKEAPKKEEKEEVTDEKKAGKKDEEPKESSK